MANKQKHAIFHLHFPILKRRDGGGEEREGLEGEAGAWGWGVRTRERAGAPRQTLGCQRYARRCLVSVNGNYCGMFAAALPPFSFQVEVREWGVGGVMDVYTEEEDGGDEGEI